MSKGSNASEGASPMKRVIRGGSAFLCAGLAAVGTACHGQGIKTDGKSRAASPTLAAATAPVVTSTSVLAKLDGPLARIVAGGTADRTGDALTSVIAHLSGNRDELQTAESARLQSLQVVVTRRLPIIHSVVLSVPTRNLATLAGMPFLTHLSINGVVRKSDAFTVGDSGAGAAYQTYGLTGAGVGVAVLDSGIHGVNDLAQNVSGGTSRVKGKIALSTTNPDDLLGHGTHVAGIIAGNGAASTGSKYTQTFYGVARQANLLNIKVLDDTGVGSVDGVIAGIAWAILNKPFYNIRVMNISLGHPVGESYTTDPLCLAVEAAWKSGIVVVCAAGNNGRLNGTNDPTLTNEGWGAAYGSITCPGNDPYVITVGAMKQVDTSRADDRIATYSSRGPSRLDLVLKPDLVAPGNQVISLNVNGSSLDQTYGSTNDVPYSVYSNQTGVSKDYFSLSGTSMAAPVVSGAVALMLQKSPLLTPDTVKVRLMQTADKWAALDGTTDPCTYGAGYLNIPAALQSATVATQYAVSPTLLKGSNNVVSINLSNIWSSSALWGTVNLTTLGLIWGPNAISGVNGILASDGLMNSSVWGDHAIWGESTGSADLSSTAIFGEN